MYNFFISFIEPVRVGVVLKNPLGIALMLRHISLVWQFSPQSNQVSGYILSNFIQGLHIPEQLVLVCYCAVS